MGGTKLMDQMQCKELLAPFPPAAIRKRQGGGGRSFDYISGGDVIRRIIDATFNNYVWMVTRLEFVSDGKAGFWLCEGKLELPGIGTRSGVGTQQALDLDSPKGAETDAFKRAARLFGVALQLYEDDAPAAAPAPVRQTTPAPPQSVQPIENAKALEQRVRAELAKMGIFEPKRQAEVMVAIYGSKPDKWTANVFEAILSRPGTQWRQAVEDIDKRQDAADKMHALAAAGKGHEHEPT
jgi:hypothetical protein